MAASAGAPALPCKVGINAGKIGTLVLTHLVNSKMINMLFAWDTLTIVTIANKVAGEEESRMYRQSLSTHDI